jgi:hypothetical protein
MRNRFPIFIALFLFLFFFGSSTPLEAFRIDDQSDPASGIGNPVSPLAGEVISDIPSPSSPFGFTWDGENLWVGSYSGILYKVDPANGDILHQMDAPGTVASGLGWDWHALWVSDRDNDVIDRVDPVTGDVLWTLEAPEAWPGGLGWDGENLWHSNYYSPSHIYYMDEETGVIIDDFPAPMERGMGIAWDGISLWNADYINDIIFELDPLTGGIRNSFAAPDDSPHDLAYDGHYLWVVIGGGSNRLYQLEPGNKDVSVGLSPSATTISPGGVLEVTASLLNHTDTLQNIEVRVDIYLPNGNPYPGNPFFGPLSLPFGPGAYIARTLTHPVPGNTPAGDYLYQAVLTIGGETVDITDFNFTVE